jgi:hypothetical protein
MHKHTAVENEHGVFTIHRDGKQLICPKKVNSFLVPMQGSHLAGGQPQLGLQTVQMPCETACPFAEVKEESRVTGRTADEKETQIIYEISCEGGCKKILLEEIIPYKKPSGLQVTQ